MRCIVITAEQRTQILAKSALSAHLKIEPIELEDGTFILNADILTEIGPSGLFARFADILDPIGQDETAVRTIDPAVTRLKEDVREGGR